MSKQSKLGFSLITLAALLPTVTCAPSTNIGQTKERRSDLAYLIDAGCVFTLDENENAPRTATFSDSRATDELLIRNFAALNGAQVE
ncbi:hypothetical protein NZK35_13300 [Stieleria sp. ICT_E10.1]|uniref:hypothetical protein n=1 Tax=Stieleria sedimenti TaxID=2976331 RepID=UPI0021805821|nr:hypothetical protein [Stieleria sedimenti]MCS7467624.1 hypothetical protein [Stieleria sedimenti]